MTTIDPSLYLHNQATTRTPSAELGKNEFLQILMTQLQNQDPTKPMDDTEFISQLATFSQLEQSMNMANSIEQLVQNQFISPVIQNSHMIDKEVSYQAYDKETGDKLDIESSSVVAVSQYEGHAVLELDNGEGIYADAVLQINKPTAEGRDDNVIDPLPKGSE
ncbi:flagellar hook assembly protein FlgD [Virgibacillus sp. NKC19-16]|uniref:flagellar hook assembly protein FlgD n=1 Tax=Virgibacillus salidurans TaxID=2831673 RepID=UPI001F328BB1|nr:flagellar hook assembly protein FlgD [Virgibacillus sp. NKC19-16]UJL47941.1 flagellar hook assembly protein FlgD [Virgibacillus sp. NKC19-16]